MLFGSVVVLTMFLFSINERDIASIYLFPLIAVPIQLFDLITNDSFTPGECSILCFPTLPEVLFTILLDIIIFYMISCFIAYFTRKIPKSVIPE